MITTAATPLSQQLMTHGKENQHGTESNQTDCTAPRRRRRKGYLNLLLHRPAVPELDGTKPYEEMILAFALQGEHEPNGCYNWDCFENHRLWKESIDILIEKLSHYELIVCFTPQVLLR